MGTAYGEPSKFLECALGYTKDDCLLWPFGKDRDGYGTICWNGMKRYSHRVICEKIHGRPPSPEHQTAHSCGNGRLGCVNPRHLRWATPKENSADMIDHGRSMRGERHPLSKLTHRETLEIYQRAHSGEVHRIIAEEFGVSRSMVSMIKSRSRWSWLTRAAA